MVKRFAVCALVVVLALAAAACGASSRSAMVHLAPPTAVSDKGIGIGPGPFVLKGGFAGGGGSGLWGDGSSGPRGSTVGCIDGRRYWQALGIANRSKQPVTLTGARAANPAPGTIGLAAIQLRLSPPLKPRTGLTNWGGTGMDLVVRGWSATPTRPLTLPPGRIATVQTNYLMRNCRALAGGKTIVVPGSLVLRYHMSGHDRRKAIPLPGDRILLREGPTKRQCAPVSGSASLVAADTTCAAARRATQACHPMSHPSWGDCTVSGVSWECGRFAGPGYPLLETCYQPTLKSHWFSTVWIAKYLTLWGAFSTAHGRSLAGGDGTCRISKRALLYRSGPLQLGPGFGVARIVLSMAGYRGPGDYGAHQRASRAGIRAAITGSTAKGAPSGTYVALAGRVAVTREKHSLGGTVYARLGLQGGTERIDLNGNWGCRGG